MKQEPQFIPNSSCLNGSFQIVGQNIECFWKMGERERERESEREREGEVRET